MEVDGSALDSVYVTRVELGTRRDEHRSTLGNMGVVLQSVPRYTRPGAVWAMSAGPDVHRRGAGNLMYLASVGTVRHQPGNGRVGGWWVHSTYCANMDSRNQLPGS